MYRTIHITIFWIVIYSHPNLIRVKSVKHQVKSAMVEAFEIVQARLVESTSNKVETDTNKVLVFIVHSTKTIYLWRGKNAGITEKLMGTRVAAKLSHNHPNYRIRPISEGNEPAAFLHLIGKSLDEP